MADEILSWAGWLVAIVASLFLIRGTVRFDVNKWLENRREQKLDNIRALCPHMRVSFDGDRIMLNSTFVSPPGTTAWQCQVCGIITHDGGAVEASTKYWAENINELSKRNKKINKQLKRLGRG